MKPAGQVALDVYRRRLLCNAPLRFAYKIFYILLYYLCRKNFTKPASEAQFHAFYKLPKKVIDVYFFRHSDIIYLRSISSNCFFTSSPQAKPTRSPVLPMTLWQGTRISIGFLFTAPPMALAFFASPKAIAIS